MFRQLAAAALTVTALAACAGTDASKVAVPTSPPTAATQAPPTAPTEPSPPQTPPAATTPECEQLTEKLTTMTETGSTAFDAMLAGRTADALAAVDASEQAATETFPLLPGVSAEDQQAYLSRYAAMRAAITANANTPLDEAAAKKAVAPVEENFNSPPAQQAAANMSAAYAQVCPADAGVAEPAPGGGG